MIDEAIRNGPAFTLMVVGLVVIFAPLIAERFRIPGLLGLLIGGALIGPNMLGILDDFSAVENIGQIGVLYLIFLAGLQLDRQTFDRYRQISVGFGLITASVSLVLGTLVALWLGFDTKAAILIGSFWASFTLIAYPVLQQYNLSKNRAGAAVIGASAVTDTVSLVILALVVGSETGDQSGLGLVLVITVGLVLLGAYCLVVLPLVTRWAFSTFGRGRILRFMLVFVGLLSAAVVAQIVGIEPLLGAFFAGLGLNRVIPNESLLMEHIDFIGNALFIPVFLVSVGLIFDPAVMFVASTLWLALWLTIALVAGKIIAAWLSGRIWNLTRPEAGLLFSVSAAQAAATLAGTIIGLEIGLYGDEVVNAVMVVIAVSLIITSVATPRYAARIEQPVAERRRLGEVVLVASHGAGIALTARLRLAGRVAEADGGVLVPVVVSVPQSDEVLAADQDRTRATDDALRALGLVADSRLRIDGSIGEGIARAAVENNASLVVLGWSGARQVTSAFVESLADQVSREVGCPVVVAALVEPAPDRVLLAVAERDLSPSRLDDLHAAAGIAVTASQRGLIVGPVSPERLTELGVALPETAEHRPGPAALAKWADRVSEPDDLVVAVSRGRAFGRAAANIHRDGRSVVAVVASKAPRWVTGDPSPSLSMRSR